MLFILCFGNGGHSFLAITQRIICRQAFLRVSQKQQRIKTENIGRYFNPDYQLSDQKENPQQHKMRPSLAKYISATDEIKQEESKPRHAAIEEETDVAHIRTHIKLVRIIWVRKISVANYPSFRIVWPYISDMIQKQVG